MLYRHLKIIHLVIYHLLNVYHLLFMYLIVVQFMKINMMDAQF